MDSAAPSISKSVPFLAYSKFLAAVGVCVCVWESGERDVDDLTSCDDAYDDDARGKERKRKREQNKIDLHKSNIKSRVWSGREKVEKSECLKGVSDCE